MEKLLEKIYKIYFIEKTSYVQALQSIKNEAKKKRTISTCGIELEYIKQLLEDIDTVIERGLIEDEVLDIADCYYMGYDQVVDDIKKEL